MAYFALKDMLPHHPASVQPNMQQSSQQHSAVTATASFPDGPSMASAPPTKPPGPASGALSDLLGLENELTSIQVGIEFHTLCEIKCTTFSIFCLKKCIWSVS